MDAARNQIIGSSAGLIPFIEKNYVYRSLMGSNQQRQAVPLIQPQARLSVLAWKQLPLATPVRSSWLKAMVKSSKPAADEVVVKYKEGSVTYEPQHFVRSNEGTSINQKVVVNTGDKVKTGDVLIEGMSIDGWRTSTRQRPARGLHAMGRLQLRRCHHH